MSHPHSPDRDRSILSSTTANTSPQKKPTTTSTSFSAENKKPDTANEAHSMDYHRQVLKGKLEDESNGAKYISPSDGIMSPCTQKLSALKGRHFGKAKPKSLFAQTQMAKKDVDVDNGGGEVDGKKE